MGGQRPASPNRPPCSRAVVAPIRPTLLSMVQMTRPPDAEVHSAMAAARTSTRNVSASGVMTCRYSTALKAGGDCIDF